MKFTFQQSLSDQQCIFQFKYAYEKLQTISFSHYLPASEGRVVLHVTIA